MGDEIKVLVASHGAGRNLVMYYIDDVTGERPTRTTGTRNRRDADRAAAVWQDELNSGRYQAATKLTWAAFRERYEAEHLPDLKPTSQDSAAVSMDLFERLINPKRLNRIDTDLMSRFRFELRKTGIRDSTVDHHLRQIRAAMGWAAEMGMIAKAPKIQRSKRAKGQKLMRGRPITAEEFERMLAAVPKARPRCTASDHRTWKRYLRGLWLSGLRLRETLALSWDPDAPFAVDLDGKHPQFRIRAEAQKAGRDDLVPMTPDFARFLLETPQGERQGPVFVLPGAVGQVVSAIGKKAGVVVDRSTKMVPDPDTGKPVEVEVVKYASAHDLRRAFGTRWAKRVMPAVLKRLMRHAAIETTMGYYVGLDADDVAGDLWREFDRPHTSPHTGQFSGGEGAKAEKEGKDVSRDAAKG